MQVKIKDYVENKLFVEKNIYLCLNVVFSK